MCDNSQWDDVSVVTCPGLVEVTVVVSIIVCPGSRIVFIAPGIVTV